MRGRFFNEETLFLLLTPRYLDYGEYQRQRESAESGAASAAAVGFRFINYGERVYNLTVRFSIEIIILSILDKYRQIVIGT